MQSELTTTHLSIIIALASGLSLVQAAKQSKVTLQAVEECLADSDFRQLVEKKREEMLDPVSGCLTPNGKLLDQTLSFLNVSPDTNIKYQVLFILMTLSPEYFLEKLLEDLRRIIAANHAANEAKNLAESASQLNDLLPADSRHLLASGLFPALP